MPDRARVLDDLREVVEEGPLLPERRGGMIAMIICLAASTFGLPSKIDQDHVPTDGKFPAGPAGNGAWVVSASSSGSFASRYAKIEAGLKTKAAWPEL